MAEDNVLEMMKESARDLSKEEVEELNDICEKMLRYNEKIKQLESVDVDCKNQHKKSLLKVSKYEKKLVELFERGCHLSGYPKDAGRPLLMDKNIDIIGDEVIDNALNACINSGSTLDSPVFGDVVKCIEHCNENANLGMNAVAQKSLAEDAYSKIISSIQSLRQKDLYESFAEIYENNEDPAKFSRPLWNKLVSNHQSGQKRLADVVAEFSRRQRELLMSQKSRNQVPERPRNTTSAPTATSASSSVHQNPGTSSAPLPRQTHAAKRNTRSNNTKKAQQNDVKSSDEVQQNDNETLTDVQESSSESSVEYEIYSSHTSHKEEPSSHKEESTRMSASECSSTSMKNNFGSSLESSPAVIFVAERTTTLKTKKVSEAQNNSKKTPECSVNFSSSPVGDRVQNHVDLRRRLPNSEVASKTSKNGGKNYKSLKYRLNKTNNEQSSKSSEAPMQGQPNEGGQPRAEGFGGDLSLDDTVIVSDNASDVSTIEPPCESSVEYLPQTNLRDNSSKTSEKNKSSQNMKNVKNLKTSQNSLHTALKNRKTSSNKKSVQRTATVVIPSTDSDSSENSPLKDQDSRSLRNPVKLKRVTMKDRVFAEAESSNREDELSKGNEVKEEVGSEDLQNGNEVQTEDGAEYEDKYQNEEKK